MKATEQYFPVVLFILLLYICFRFITANGSKSVEELTENILSNLF